MFIKGGETSRSQTEIRCCPVDRTRPADLKEEEGGGDVVRHDGHQPSKVIEARVSPSDR